MKAVQEFLLLNWAGIVSSVVVLALLLLRGKFSKYIKDKLFTLAFDAEEAYGGGTGALKYKKVSTWLFECLPVYMKVFFTTKQIDKMLEDAVVKLKEWIKENDKAKELLTPCAPEDIGALPQ